MADLRNQVAVRDSKIPQGDALTVSTGAFAAFVDGMAKGRRGTMLS
ncbi:hypothetical protein M2271_005688 [Streptomyces sp. LBL]|nr:hypothetical protein [Streptomyces sp. LBL]